MHTQIKYGYSRQWKIIQQQQQKILTNIKIWMNFENIIPVKDATHKRSHIVWFNLYEMSRISRSIGTESRSVVATGWG